jgi:hypothetical protein
LISARASAAASCVTSIVIADTAFAANAAADAVVASARIAIGVTRSTATGGISSIAVGGFCPCDARE